MGDLDFQCYPSKSFISFSSGCNVVFPTNKITRKAFLAPNASFPLIIGPANFSHHSLCLSDDKTGDNPIMIAAKLRHKDLVSSVLRSSRFDGSDDIDFLSELIHSRNASGQTLLAMVALQGRTRPG